MITTIRPIARDELSFRRQLRQQKSSTSTIFTNLGVNNNERALTMLGSHMLLSLEDLNVLVTAQEEGQSPVTGQHAYLAAPADDTQISFDFLPRTTAGSSIDQET
jgi:hypothetical protein